MRDWAIMGSHRRSASGAGSTGSSGKCGSTVDWAPARASSGPQGGRVLDTARGILICLRRCPSQAAEDELVAAARRHKVPVFALAWALVRLAGDGGKVPHTFSTAQSAARHEWGELFAQPTVRAC